MTVTLVFLTGFSAGDIQVEELDNNPDGNAIQDYCNKITGARTVPRVWVNGKFVGGGDEVAAGVKKGKLKK